MLRDNWAQGVLVLLGSLIADNEMLQATLKEVGPKLQELQAEVDGRAKPAEPAESAPEGLGFPGTASFEDGPEPFDPKPVGGA